MALPKRRHSKTRRDSRRTQDNLELSLLVKCGATGVFHLPHSAYRVGDDLYYGGKLFRKNFFSSSKK